MWRNKNKKLRILSNFPNSPVQTIGIGNFPSFSPKKIPVLTLIELIVRTLVAKKKKKKLKIEKGVVLFKLFRFNFDFDFDLLFDFIIENSFCFCVLYKIIIFCFSKIMISSISYRNVLSSTVYRWQYSTILDNTAEDNLIVKSSAWHCAALFSSSFYLEW